MNEITIGIIIIGCGFLAVLTVLRDMRQEAKRAADELLATRYLLLEMNAHLKGIPSDFGDIKTHLHNIRLVIDPQWDEKQSDALGQTLRSGRFRGALKNNGTSSPIRERQDER